MTKQKIHCAEKEISLDKWTRPICNYRSVVHCTSDPTLVTCGNCKRIARENEDSEETMG